MVDGQIEAHASIECTELVRELTFIPSSYHLLAYCDLYNRLLTHYDVKGK